MIKNNTDKILKKVLPNYTKTDKKWINTYNELQYRIDAIFESLVTFYTGGVLLMHLSPLENNLFFNRSLEPLRIKMFIFNSYMFTELNNLLVQKGESSITTFINYWKKILIEDEKKFTSIFGEKTDKKLLIKHFNKFQKWLIEKDSYIKKIKYYRDKNFSHIDNNFVYESSFSYESIIEIVVFISDYLSKLNTIIDMLSLMIVDGKPVAINKYESDKLNIDILRIRFQNEIDILSDIYYKGTKRNLETLRLNCFDSIEETLNRLKLINFDNY